MWAESDFEGLENEIQRILNSPSKDAAVAAAWLFKLEGGTTNIAESFEALQRLQTSVPEALLNRKFIIDSLWAQDAEFALILKEMDSKEGMQLTWSPSGIPLASTRDLDYIDIHNRLTSMFDEIEEENSCDNRAQELFQPEMRSFCIRIGQNASTAVKLEVVNQQKVIQPETSQLRFDFATVTSGTTTPEPPQSGKMQFSFNVASKVAELPKAPKFSFDQKPAETAAPKFSFDASKPQNDVKTTETKPVQFSFNKPAVSEKPQQPPAATTQFSFNKPAGEPKPVAFSFNQAPATSSTGTTFTPRTELPAVSPGQEVSAVQLTAAQPQIQQQPLNAQPKHYSVSVAVQLAAEIRRILQRFGLETLAEKNAQRKILSDLGLAPPQFDYVPYRGQTQIQRIPELTQTTTQSQTELSNLPEDVQAQLKQKTHSLTDTLPKDLTKSTIFDQDTVRRLMSGFTLE